MSAELNLLRVKNAVGLFPQRYALAITLGFIPIGVLVQEVATQLFRYPMEMLVAGSIGMSVTLPIRFFMIRGRVSPELRDKLAALDAMCTGGELSVLERRTIHRSLIASFMDDVRAHGAMKAKLPDVELPPRPEA